MKTISKKIEKTYRRKLLTTSISAVCTAMLASSVSNASDIDIYKTGQAGATTLMLVLDTSGSMGYPQLQKDKGACDIPSNTSVSSYKNTNSTNGSPIYKRYYCEADKLAYFYKRTGSNGNYRYYQCEASGSATSNSCTIAIDELPVDASEMLTTQTGSTLFYYRPKEYKYYDRITRLKDGLFDLLVGNKAKGIEKLDDSLVIGLSTYSRPTNGNSTTIPTKADNYRGIIRIPARALSEKVNGITQRQILLNEIAVLGSNGGTPTAHAYAEAAAYLMGTSTKGKDYSGFTYAYNGVTSGDNYKQPDSLKNAGSVDGEQCSGQGIYVLTDGEQNYNDNASDLMKAALGSKANNFSCITGGTGNSATAWDCTEKFYPRLLDPSKNPAGLVIKTAVIGFGGEFGKVPKYDKELDPDDEANNRKLNIDKINATTGISTAVKNTAKWGVNAGGGWYRGSASQDIVESFNDFVTEVGGFSTPSVTTGTPTIPKDALNPAMLQDDAYYQQFSPTPDKPYQLWLGNLKKYFVDANGVFKDKEGNKIVDNKGQILPNYDYWSESIVNAQKDADEDVKGSTKFALRGGAWSRVLLRTDPVGNPATGKIQRLVLTNRFATGTGSSATFDATTATNTELRQVKPTDLTDATYQYDPKRGYLVRMLGYNLENVDNPAKNLDGLTSGNEFRQMGAVMHSSPLLITNEGAITFKDGQIGSEDRKDYILFGSTQGVLHVVEAGKTKVAGGGKEVFAFVPNEMLDSQPEAFEKPEATSGGVNSLFYGIDAPWTAYTEYVIASDGKKLTVGTGKGGQKGVQDVYGGLRMGGRSYYALDLVDIEKPKLKFHINPDAAATGTPLSYMGQSWSKPSIGFVNWKGKRTRVMFVGGGYDMGYEATDYDQTNKKGAGVYMFDANDGKLLWWSSANVASSSAEATNSGVIATKADDMKYSVVSQIRTVDRDGDDLIDHIYFGDLGGQIWRIDFDNKQNVIGKVVKAPVRLLDGHQANGKSPRFYDMPAFSLYSSAGTTFAAISQGSGNRSKPLFADSSYSYDAMYNIYDKDVARKDLFSATAWNSKDIKADNSLGLRKITDADRKDDTTLKAPFSTHGWYYEFSNCLAEGGVCNSVTYKQQTEKVFGTPVALNKKLFVSTFDASKDGLAGTCGAGVKGASLMTTFCMPYGQCEVDDATGTTRGTIGAGIHTITVGNDHNDGNGSGNGNGNNDDGLNNPKKVASSQNYCVSTGGRVTITVTGSSGQGEKTQMCLIPQRWYEKLY